MTKIYTKTGDKGSTGLVDGSRVSKSSFIIDTYGEVDELNSCIGIVCSFNIANHESDTLKFIQNKLFDLGSLLACPPESREKFKLSIINKANIDSLEKAIDRLQQGLPELKNFILPGGGHCAAHTHICRTVCRRLERALVKLSESDEPRLVPENSIAFLNRLSDYFFVLSRSFNSLENKPEIIWEQS